MRRPSVLNLTLWMLAVSIVALAAQVRDGTTFRLTPSTKAVMACTDPTSGGGLAATTGSICLGDAGVYRKTGAGDTNWDLVIADDGGEVIAQPLHLGLTIDNGTTAITTGLKGCTTSPATGTITAATLLSTDAAGPATTGSIVIDVWKDTFANYPPTDADSITASAPPTLSSDNETLDTTLTGWTTSVTAGDILCFNVDSASTVTRVSLFLKVE